jgi:hypothetical protein
VLQLRRFVLPAWLALVVAHGGGPALADSVVIEPDQDTSLYEENGSLSNGAGIFLFSGNTSSLNARRALMRFDVAGAVPRGSLITSATVSLWCNQSPTSGPETQTFELHRLETSWGEARSDAGSPGGGGAPAQTGDATWTERFFNQGQRWAAGGGDFVALPSANGSVSGICQLDAPIQFDFSSTPQLVFDVQSWLDTPRNNFGWAVVGDEVDPSTARRFLSRDASALQPTLQIEYTSTPAVPATTPLGVAIGVLALLGLSAWTLRGRIAS